MRRLVFIFALGIASFAQAASPAAIDASLKKAKDFLYKQQSGAIWKRAPSKTDDPSTGYTAIAVYAMLASGEDRQDPRIAKSIEFLEKTDSTSMDALGIRCQIWSLLPQTPTVKDRLAKDALALTKAPVSGGDKKGFYLYDPDGKEATHNPGQYAVLGMLAASQCGFEVPNVYWQALERAWGGDQDSSGAWSYLAKPNEKFPLSPGMTAAGVATMYITQDFLHASDVFSSRGNIVNPSIDQGTKWIGDHFDQITSDAKTKGEYPFATLFSIGRLGSASGMRYLGNIDWYDRCTTWLIEKQKTDGAWPSEIGYVPSTAFAMLFLSRGRDPMAMNKLDYSTPTMKKTPPWNQRPRDVSGITRWIGHQLERELNWQIVNINSDVSDWHDAPILFIAGNEDLPIDAAGKAKLKQFVEEGGMIVANADGQSRPFGTAFKKLGQELFRNYEFRELPANHVIYTSEQFPRAAWKAKPVVLGLSNGVRELMLLLPAADVSKFWQLQSVTGHEESWQLGSDLFLYSCDPSKLRRRGENDWMNVATNKATRAINIARIRYGGNWDPEPAGWRKLQNWMRGENNVELDVKNVDLASDDFGGAKIAHITGTDDVHFDDAAKQKLKTFFSSGGFLIADAAGGSEAFANGMQRELGAIFPEVKFAATDRSSPIYSSGGKTMTDFAFRKYASHVINNLKDEPRLQKIQLGDKTIGVLSGEDLSGGLVGESVDGIVGYEPEVARQIVSHAILFAK